MIELKFLDMIRAESEKDSFRIVTYTAISGIAQGATVAVINEAAMTATQGDLNIRYFLFFILLMAAYIIAKYQAMTLSSRLVERLICSLRNRIAEKIRSCDLQKFEHLGRAEIFTLLSREAVTISDTAPVIINAAGSAVMLVVTGLYIAVLSKTALLLIGALIFAGSTYWLATHNSAMGILHQAMVTENRFFTLLNHMLNGFKEVKMNRSRSNDLYQNYICKASQETGRMKTEVTAQFNKTIIFGQAFFYMMVAAVIFLLPTVDSVSAQTITQLTAACLFVVGPIGEVVGVMPHITRANVAVDNLKYLESTLDLAPEPVDESNSQLRLKRVTQVEHISLQDVRFSYRDKNGQVLFSVGPISLEVPAGQLVYIVGGNGSGKSTFLKLLTGLYKADSGQILLNGIPIDIYNQIQFREFFSVIFTDFHLFDRLYGFSNIDKDRVDFMLTALKLIDKTGLVSDHFTNLDLSTGQRKRLALLVSLLEDRQIYIFDEVAADQDPDFRQYFYERMLKELKSRGKTVIVVTHDDRYFHTADRVLKMEYGNFLKE